MKLWTILNVFQEARNLPRCIASIEENFYERIEYINHVFIDGAYRDYASPVRLSDDGTREIATEHGHLIDAPDVSECDKRNAALRYIDTQAQNGDWLLYLDADETITEVFSWPQRVGVFSFVRRSDNREYDRCRLYRWEPGLHFTGRHYKLHSADGSLVAGLGTAPDFQTVGHGIHYDTSHSARRMAVKKDYYSILSKQEQAVPA